MKKAKVVTWLLCLILMLQTIPVSAEVSNESNWSISSISLKHTSVEFQISGVESAQDATVVVESRDSYSSVEEEKVHYEIPFSISSATENIKVEIPGDGYLPSGDYSLYVLDSSNNKTRKRNASVYGHYSFPDYELYPNWGEITNDYDATYHVQLTVGFENYDVVMEPKSTKIISYPHQEIGTPIEVKRWDDYGCSDSETGTVKNEYLYLSSSSLHAFKDSIAAYNIDLDENERVGVEVEGKKYYSNYGDGDGEYKMIPNFITYPQVSNTTTTISAWIESKNGSKSESVEKEIETCSLRDCDITCNGYMSQASGSVKANEYGNRITRVSTSLDGKQYICDVDAEGNFLLKYPKQKNNTKITLIFSDEHGCNVSKDISIVNTLENMQCDIKALLSRASGWIYKDCRLVAQIGDKLYYSDYATIDSAILKQIVTVSYPQQKVGQSISFWFEKKDSSQSPIYTIQLSARKYFISANARTNKINGTIEAEYNNNCEYRVFVNAGGKEYECKLIKKDAYENEDYDGDADYYYEFSGEYPLQKVGKTIQVIVRDADGYEYSESIVLKNIKPKLSFKQINTSTTKVKGTTVAKSRVSVKVGKKTYKGKANKNGKFSIKIKAKKAGTKVTVSVLTPEGYTNKKVQKIKKTSGYPVLAEAIYRTSNIAKINVYGGKKGDKLKVKIGSKTYTKKIKRDKRKQTISLKIQKADAGTNIQLTLYDRFGEKKDSDTSKVYYGDTIFVGMSAEDALLTTWGPPERRNYWGDGSVQWVFTSGSSTLYAYISNGRVVSIQHLNY